MKMTDAELRRRALAQVAAEREHKELALAQDSALASRDRERFEAGVVTGASVRAAMQSFRVTGDAAILATPYHNEMPAGLLQKPGGALMFVFNRNMGHWSGHGVRMVDLEIIPVAGAEPLYKVTGEMFVAKPSRPPVNAPAPAPAPIHFVLDGDDLGENEPVQQVTVHRPTLVTCARWTRSERRAWQHRHHRRVVRRRVRSTRAS